jgi:hypothetical protein
MADEPPQGEGAPQSLEEIVVQTLQGAIRSREGWEELRGEDEPPMSDVQVFLENMISEVRQHGLILSRIAMVPSTREELQASMPDAIDRVPAWMEAKVFGSPLMTPRLFLRGIAQLMAVQRVAIERVTAEQVDDPAPIEAGLGSAPLPDGDNDELADDELTAAVGAAMLAHVQALIEIARDFDAKAAQLGIGLGNPDH